jgi:hypothetical protein
MARAVMLVLISACLIVVYGWCNRTALISGSRDANTFAAPMINAHLRNNNNVVSEMPSRPRTDRAVADARPHFIIHIGPHKTGTTFLQGTLSVESADTVLEMDNYYYLGTTLRAFRREDKLAFDMRSIFNQSPEHRPSPSSSPPALNEDFAALLRWMRAKGRSGILIHEALHKIRPEYVQVLADALNKDWKVIVVEGYRPLHEWLVSRFNQFVWDEYSTSIWPDGTGRDGDDDDGGVAFPPGLRFGLTTNTRFDRFTHPFILSNSSIFEPCLGLWIAHFENVRLVDMSNLPPRPVGEDPYLMHFVCDVVPGAANLCGRAPDLAGESGRDMSSSQYGVAYESLATWSWQLRLIDRRLDRRLVKDAIRDHHVVGLNGTTLPASCPPPSEMDALWQWTLQTDERLFGKTYHRDRESASDRARALRASFERSARRNKFCGVDPSILFHEDWKPLLASLDAIARGQFDVPSATSVEDGEYKEPKASDPRDTGE